MTRSSSTAGACLAAATLLTSMATTTPVMAQPGPELSIPAGFVHLTDVAQTIALDVRYHGSNNFLGRPVRGYHAPTCILTLPAAHRLRDIQRELRPSGLSLKVFDCYRPQQAVDDFIAWARDPADQKAKAAYYPNVPKDMLFERGFIAERSGHSRGSTVDLTLAVLPPAALAEAPRSSATDKAPVALPTRGALLPNGEVDMGTPFDLFDVQSHTDNPDLPEEVRHNRKFLATLMLRHGFTGVQEEWWHFTLLDEPYPDTYFNFPVR